MNAVEDLPHHAKRYLITLACMSLLVFLFLIFEVLNDLYSLVPITITGTSAAPTMSRGIWSDWETLIPPTSLLPLVMSFVAYRQGNYQDSFWISSSTLFWIGALLATFGLIFFGLLQFII